MELIAWIALRSVTAVAAGSPQLQADATIFIQFVLFVLVWLGLTVLVFRPYLRARHDRDGLTVGARREAESLDAQAEEVLREYETRLGAAREEAQAERSRRARDGSDQAEAMLSDARQEADRVVRTEREQLEQQLAEARASVQPQAQQLSSAIVRKILAT